MCVLSCSPSDSCASTSFRYSFSDIIVIKPESRFDPSQYVGNAIGGLLTGLIAKQINSNTWLIVISLGIELCQYLWVLKLLPDSPPLHHRLKRLLAVSLSPPPRSDPTPDSSSGETDASAES